MPACKPSWWLCGAAAQVLEGYGPQEWICFERALVVRDIFTGGVRTFLSRAEAQAFRARIYRQYGGYIGPHKQHSAGNVGAQEGLCILVGALVVWAGFTSGAAERCLPQAVGSVVYAGYCLS